MYNSQWSDKVDFKELIEISSNFTVGQLILAICSKNELRMKNLFIFMNFCIH